jgi:PAS domain S-box-containing protein
MLVDVTHLTSLFENATEGIILTDSKGKIVLVNPAAERMFGYSSKEIIGEQVELLIPQRYQHHHKNLRDGFYKKPSNRVMGQGRDLFARKKDGTDMPVEVSLSHYERDGELFVIAFIIDITKRKEIERNMALQQEQLEKVSNEMRKLNTELEAKVEQRTIILKEALEKLESSQIELSEALSKEKQLNEIKSRFVSMASHEFRTPLSTVLSSASLLSRYTAADEQEKRDRHINKIKDAVKHLNDILEDFLSLGRLDEGRVQAKLSEFNCADVIYETIDEIKGLLKDRQEIKVNFKGAEVACTDPKLLKNILINLLTNASKFSDEGSLIQVEYERVGDNALLSVKDNGIGISDEDKEHLFSTFFRGANVTNIAGTGLGLHIVRRYVDLLHGTVSLQSELNKGTTVTIEIPVTHKTTTT